MVEALSDEQVKTFEELFANPTLNDMLEVPWQEFEGFVDYVFTCAGYAVKNVSKQKWPNGPGVDLELYHDRPGGKLAALVEVRRYTPPNNIDSNQAHAFANKLNIKGVPGYIVTTSDFVEGARAVAAAAAAKGRLRLVNGAHLLRYIAYIRGSRIKEPGPRQPTTPAATPPDILFKADTLARRSATDTMVLTVGNNRGGVAKTTTALNLALALAESNRRVLLVDMDPQSSLTSALPAPAGTPESGSLVDYFVRAASLPGLVRETRFTNLSLLPASPEMRMADLGGGAHPDQEMAFVAALHDDKLVAADGGKVDWIIMDTPPGQSFFTRSALAAAHYVLVPAALDTWAALGMNGLLDTASAMRGLMGSGVEVVGCLLTRYRPGPIKPDDMSKFELDLSIRRVSLFETKIRHDDRLEGRNKDAVKGILAGILEFAKQKGTGATDYQAALEELKRYVHDD
jgi:chromosome partitioning protein